MNPIGRYSRRYTLAKLDGRRREARLLQVARDELLAHVGGAPSAVQARLIERAAMLTLHVALFDARAIEANGLSDRDAREYLAYSNSLTRALAQLGIKAAALKPPSLAEHFARRDAERQDTPAAA